MSSDKQACQCSEAPKHAAVPAVAPACGCPLCPLKSGGLCGITRDAAGKAVCVCGFCGGACSGETASEDPELDDSCDRDYCEQCFTLENFMCLACVCCGYLHNSKGDIMYMDDMLSYDSERDDMEKARELKNANARKKRADKSAKCASKSAARKKARLAAHEGESSAPAPAPAPVPAPVPAPLPGRVIAFIDLTGDE